MRLQSYLNEARYRKIKLKRQKKFVDPISRIKKAKAITQEILNELNRKLSNKNYDVSFNELIKIMNSISKRYKIKFKRGTGKETEEDWVVYDYCGMGLTKFDGSIEISLLDKVVKYIKDAKNNITNINSDFANEIIGVMGHELIHRSQFQKYGPKIIKSNLTVKSIKDDFNGYVEYLKQGYEMMAYAQDAAHEILNNKEPNMFYLYQNYFGQTEPTVFQKFIKILKQEYYKISGGDELEIELQ